MKHHMRGLVVFSANGAVRDCLSVCGSCLFLLVTLSVMMKFKQAVDFFGVHSGKQGNGLKGFSD